MSAIVCRDLLVGYGATTVVDHLQLDLQPGQLAVLMGTNGSGKSTLLKTLAGLIPPLGGTVEVLGATPGTMPRSVAFLAQRPKTAFGLPIRAADVVAMGRYPLLGLVRPAGRADRAACTAAMKRLGVDQFANKPLMNLSGGQQQRTFLAQMLVREPKVVLLDEPTAGLDPGARSIFTEVINELRQEGVAVVVATHDLADAEDADVAILLARRVVGNGAPAEVLTDDNLRVCFGFTDRH